MKEIKDNVRWIHKDLGKLNKLERAKVGIEFFVPNLKAHGFTGREMEELSRYFKKESEGLEYNQTS